MPGDDVTHFYGPTINLPQAVAEEAGFSVCHSETYATVGTLITDILTKCDKQELMLACRPAGDPVFQLAAHAPRTDATFDTGQNTGVTHSANGSEWYFNSSRSWGFAPLGKSVTKASCDIEALLTQDETTPYRMCIHSNGATFGGYRCGFDTLNGDSSYERVFLHR